MPAWRLNSKDHLSAFLPPDFAGDFRDGSHSDLGWRPSEVRSSPDSGSPGITAAGPFGASIVAKVFLRGGTQIL
jgi:hypothetical protein